MRERNEYQAVQPTIKMNISLSDKFWDQLSPLHKTLLAVLTMSILFMLIGSYILIIALGGTLPTFLGSSVLVQESQVQVLNLGRMFLLFGSVGIILTLSGLFFTVVRKRKEDEAVFDEVMANVRAYLLNEMIKETSQNRSDVQVPAVSSKGRHEYRHLLRAVSPQLIIILQRDHVYDYREIAATILGEIEERRAIKPLLHLLNEASPDLVKAISWALGEMETQEAVKPLCKLVVKPTITRADVITAIAQALGKIGDLSASKCLQQILIEKRLPETEKQIILDIIDSLKKI